jgi:hypothetical protein
MPNEILLRSALGAERLFARARRVVVLVLLCLAPAAQAQVYGYFPGDPTLQNHYNHFQSDVIGNASVAGITVLIPWGAYDIGNSTSGPALDTNTLKTVLDPNLSSAASGKTINLVIEAASGGIGMGGINSATPSYVFSTAWPMNCLGCSGPPPPVDTCDCNNYQGGNYASLGSNCTNINNTSQFDSQGVPAAWEMPFYVAYEGWLKALINWYNSSNSSGSAIRAQIGYIRVGVGTGGGSVVACPAVEAGSFPGYVPTGQLPQSVFSVPKLTELIWKTYNSNVYSFVNGVHHDMVLEASMYGGETLSNNDGTTMLVWADDVAGSAVSNGLGIGAESLAGATDTGDLTLYSQGSPCSNDWCALFNQYALAVPKYLGVPMPGLQTASVSNPSCANQPSSCNQTGSLLTVLPFGTQRHGRVFEIGYPDLICAYSMHGPSDFPSTCPSSFVSPPPYLPYQTALTSADADSPNATASIGGRFRLKGNSRLP